MSLSTYTVHDLQEFDEHCRVEAEKFGLSLPNVLFHLVQAEEMYDIAARSLPGRYSHYQFGRQYEQMKGDYDKGRSRIYELVVNTDPVHAYLLDGNGIISQLLTIAHVYGHAAVFEHSQFFAPADKNILSRVRSSAARIDGYIGEYGRTKVENFIDSCEALAFQRSFDLLVKPSTAKPPVWKDNLYDDLFPEQTQERRVKYAEEREAFKRRFPKQPERDILAFIATHARYLEDWQRDIISIIHSETEYFAPQVRTQVINEATAVYYHQNILHTLMEDDRFSTQDFMEFQTINAGVLHPRIKVYNLDPDEGGPHVECTGINPYLTGHVIFDEVQRICENPTDKEREQWPHWAGQISWQEKRNELIETYDDVALLSEFLSPTVCEKSKLFMGLRPVPAYKNLRVLEEECDQVREVLVRTKRDISPTIEIVDADYKNRGELFMIHRHEHIGLDDEFTKGTMPHLIDLWGHPVVIQSIAPKGEYTNKEDKDVWYRGVDTETAINRSLKEPS